VDEESENNNIIIKFEAPELYGWAYLNLEFKFTDEYPMKPPQVKFLEPIPYHPNVYTNGNICIDSLQHNWTPALKINNVVLTIFCLLTDPNPSSPANPDAGKLMKKLSEYKIKCIKSMKGGDRIKEKNKELGIKNDENEPKNEKVKKGKKVNAKTKNETKAMDESKDKNGSNSNVFFNSNNDEENNKLDLAALGMSDAE